MEPELGDLKVAVDARRASTVRICFPDHYGAMRGRRLPAEVFLDSPGTHQAFCDGALVWDVQCEIFEETNFSNYRTGYPDLYAVPDETSIRRCGWTNSEWMVLCDSVDAHEVPIGVDSRGCLRAVADRAGAGHSLRASISMRLLREDSATSALSGTSSFTAALLRGLELSGLRGSAVEASRSERRLTVHLPEMEPLKAADAMTVARMAARDLAFTFGIDLTLMPATETGQRPLASRLSFASEPAGDPAGVAARLKALRLFLAPLPISHGAGLSTGLDEPGSVVISSDANPYLAVAVSLISRAGTGETEFEASGSGFQAAIDDLRRASPSAVEWVGELMVHDALELAQREEEIRAARITPWDVERYGEVG